MNQRASFTLLFSLWIRTIPAMKVKRSLFPVLALFFLQTGFFVDPVLAQGQASDDLLTNQDMIQIFVSVRFAETTSSIRVAKVEQTAEHSDGNEPSSGARSIKSRANLLEALESRNLNEDEYRIFGPKFATDVVVGVFAPQQLKGAFTDFQKQKGMRLLEGKASGYLLPDKGFLLLKKKDRAIGVKVEMSGDKLAIGLDLFFRDSPEKNRKTYKVSQIGVVIWDGQTVALERKVSEDHFEVAFISAEIHDAAGFPIHSKKKPSPAKRPTQ